jgi:cell division protein FtsQ
MLAHPGNQSASLTGRGRALLGLLIGVALLCGTGAALFYGARLMPVRYVRLEGAVQNVDPAELERVLTPLLTSAYPWVDLNALESAARTQPWVGEAGVVRVWPDTLVVRLRELKPFARWEGGSFLSEEGVRFRAKEDLAFAHLPLLSGPEGKERLMLTLLKSMNLRLAEQGKRVAALHLNKRRALSFRLDDGLVVRLGRQDPVRAFTRFLRVTRLLGPERMQAIQRVDLRYPNGFAVGMKPDGELKLGKMAPETNHS